MIRSLFMLITIALLLSSPALAEVKVIEADYTYRMGDNDSKADARRIAIQEAKRKALELAGTFVASLTQVKEYRLTKDEVTAYTAGIVETEIMADEGRGTVDQPELYIKVRCRVDTDVLARQIDRYRENEALGEQLEAAAREKEALRKERDALQKQLAAEKDRMKAEETRKKLDTVLAGEESIDETNLLWARLAPQMDFYSGGAGRQRISPEDLDGSLAALQKAVQADPRNVRARMLLASIYQQKNDHAAAEKELRFALERAPNNPFLHMQLGTVLREQGNYQEALREFRIIEHKQPNQPQMLYQTALTHMANGNCRLAVGYSKRFLLYTRKNDRPAVAKLKPKVQAVIDECGDQPVPRKKKQQHL
jgi:tetratricopeptide (TPR) repeat protein